eukprot:1330405-Rhodomonas_salina.2
MKKSAGADARKSLLPEREVRQRDPGIFTFSGARSKCFADRSKICPPLQIFRSPPQVLLCFQVTAKDTYMLQDSVECCICLHNFCIGNGSSLFPRNPKTST